MKKRQTDNQSLRQYIKKHVDCGKVFSEWQLFEAARGCYNMKALHVNYQQLPQS
jgi:hypothetical protein